MSDELWVSEVFGPTFQGEGPTTGRRAGFVRLAGCNRSCSWCDSTHSWDWKGVLGTRFDPKEVTDHRSVEALLDTFTAMGVERVVITGGEPLIQARKVGRLAAAMLERGWAVECETNGTLSPPEVDGVQWNVSPKMPSADQPEPLDVGVLAEFAARPLSCFKFVVADEADAAAVVGVVESAGLDPRRVWLMPEGRSVEAIGERLPWVADVALGFGFNLSSRLHVAVWGDEKGH